jgi:hypothetical protein
MGKKALMLPLCDAVAKGKVTGGGATVGSGATVVEVEVVGAGVVGGIVVPVTRGRVTGLFVVGVVDADDVIGGAVEAVVGSVNRTVVETVA